jgi:hypothetical protein
MDNKDGRLGKVLEEIAIGEWLVRHQEYASICSHPKRGVWEIPNPIRDYWKNGAIERRGFPTGALRDVIVSSRVLRVMDFERGVIIWDLVTSFVFDVSHASDTAIITGLAWPVTGRWDAGFEEGVVGIHAALLHTNEVLLWAYADDGVTNDVVIQGEWSLLSLSTGRVVKREKTERNQFCCGQCLLWDGKLLAVGGDRKSPGGGSELNARTMRLYDPLTRTWTPLEDLETPRWYPTVVTYGATTAIALAGRDRTSPDESQQKSVRSALFINEGGLTGPECEFDGTFGLRSGDLGDTFPFSFVLPSGHLFVHLADQTRLPLLPNLNFFAARQAKDPTGPRTYYRQGAAVLLPLRPSDNPPYRARVMLIGGGGDGTPGDASPPPASHFCVIMDSSVSSPTWTQAKMLNDPRHMGDAVLLPDGKVLVVNGVSQGLTYGSPELGARRDAELYDPAADTWVKLAEMNTPRMYHATALLLPDGRVMSAGTDRALNTTHIARKNVEAFSPPYLFWGPRPQIKSAPESAGYSEIFLVATDEAESIKSVALIRNGSCTHSFNSDQRFIELEIVERLGRRLSVSWERVVAPLRALAFTFRWPNLMVSAGLRLRMPPNALVAPPGYYMLFLISDKGVPSVARFIRIKQTRRDPGFTVTRVEGHGQ